MKKLANLKGVKALSKNEQKSINGGLQRNCLHIACRWGCCDGACLSQGQAGVICEPAPTGDYK